MSIAYPSAQPAFLSNDFSPFLEYGFGHEPILPCFAFCFRRASFSRPFRTFACPFGVFRRTDFGPCFCPRLRTFLDERTRALLRFFSGNFILRKIFPQKNHRLNTLWPVHFESPSATIAQSFVQRQDFGGQYYHGGCESRAKSGSAVIAPIRGRLEGGYYSYERHADRIAKIKLWRPWDGKPYADLYFELAVIDSLGYRYELHHVDPMTLPASTLKLLNDSLNPALRLRSWKPECKSAASYARPNIGYHHIHFNIIAPNGLQMNPEYYTVHSDEAPIKSLHPSRIIRH